MAHEITANDQIVTRETPWHGLGVTTGRLMTSKEVMEIAQLSGWELNLIPLTVTYPDGSTAVVPERFAVVRTDINKILGVVGERYQLYGNEELFSFADAVVDTGEAVYESAGSLRDNRVIFATLRLERPLVVADVDFDPLLNITSSHDGSFAFRAGISPIVTVCMNTVHLAIAQSVHEYMIKHTANMADRVAQAREALRISFDYLDGFEVEVQKLIDTEVTRKRFEEIMVELFPSGETELQGKNADQRREAIRVMYNTDPAAAPWKGSAWGVLNAVNTWELWESDFRRSNSSPEDARAARLERQATKILRGTEAPVTQKLHKLLVAAR